MQFYAYVNNEKPIRDSSDSIKSENETLEK